MHNSCTIMDELMYGMTPRANIERLLKPPPVNMSNMPSSVPCCISNHSFMIVESIPGVGMCMPMR